LAPLPKSGIFAALSVWAFVCSFYGCLSPDPVRVFGGRWSMLSSWALLLSATYWCLSAAHVWFWETPLAAQIGPFLEILWPLVFGSATSSAVLFFAVLLPTTTWTEFDPRTRWLCAESAPWRGPPELQLLVCHGVPCLLAYWEVCNLRQLPSPSAARASSTMVNFFIAGFFANSCISYRRTRRWAYPLGAGEFNFWLAVFPVAVGFWLICKLASGGSDASVLWQKLLLPPLMSGLIFFVLSCFGLVVHYFAFRVLLDQGD